jgi:SPP1 gp7 family putative phage head morphogenesis protein
MMRIDYGEGGGRPTRLQIEAELKDRFLRHDLLALTLAEKELAGYTLTFINRRLLPELERLLDRELARLELKEGLGAESLTSQRLKAMIARIDTSLGAKYAELGAGIAERAQEMAVAEGAASTKILRDFMPIEIELQKPSAATLRAVVTKRPLQTKLLKDHVKDLDAAARRAIAGQIRLGIASGEGVAKIKARIVRKVAGNEAGPISRQIRRQADAIARTAANHVLSAAKMEIARSNPRWISGWEWVATLDPRVCPACASRDGRKYEMDSGTAPPPSIHVRCRCKPVPLPNTDAFKKAGWRMTAEDEIERASAPGTRKVALNRTFDDFLRVQTKEYQEQWMGKERAAIYRSGVPLDRLVNTQTLDFKPLAAARRVAARVGA